MGTLAIISIAKEADDYCKYYNPKEQWDDTF